LKLQLVEFIKSNPDWEQKLSEAPYYITIKRKDNFILFEYSQINSDFYNPIVKECRGIILDNAFNPVCVPFYKFGNYGEGYVDALDWNSARVQEKVDGSLIKVWNYNDEWHISTNGTIDAKDAGMVDSSPYKSFYDLFMEAANNSKLYLWNLEPDYTWMFELISPYNPVVVPYTEVSVRHIGTRNIHTLEECDIDIGIKKPKQYNFKSLEECITMASELPFTEEGYVVVDKQWHRNKVKSPAYVAVHHLKNNGMVTNSRIVKLIRENEHEEFLTYYPEFNEIFEKVQNRINEFIITMDKEILRVGAYEIGTRGDFAKLAKQTICPPVLFDWLDRKCKNAKEWLWEQTDENILDWTGD